MRKSNKIRVYTLARVRNPTGTSLHLKTLQEVMTQVESLPDNVPLEITPRVVTEKVFGGLSDFTSWEKD